MTDENLGAIHEDVPFDWTGAEELIVHFDFVAEQIEAKRGQRSAAQNEAMVDWQGQAMPQFMQRALAGDFDAVELAAALRDAAEDVRAMLRAAHEEQDRRLAARDWERQVAEAARREGERSGWDKFWNGSLPVIPPPPMPPPPVPEPHLSPPSGPASRGTGFGTVF